MQNARRATVKITYEGKDITTPIDEYLESFTYDDIASGESDRIKINIHDIDKQWMDTWMPSKGDRMSSELILYNWDSDGTEERLYCGEFELDDMSFSGRPLKGALGAVSIPRNEPFNTQKRTKTWEGITVCQIAQEIADRAGVSLYYEADTIPVGIIEQNEQTDCKFLYSVCADYGLAMKVYANKIIIFDEEAYENRPTVADIDESDMSAWNYKSTMAGTYTGANIRFTDPNNEEEYTIHIGGGNRILELNETTDSIEDAERKGIAKLNNENKKAITMSITVKTNIKILAGTCINVTGLGAKINGKYYVDKASTQKSGSGACKTKLTVHRVIPRIKSASIGTVEQAVAEEMAGSTSYTVVAGDTLCKIANQFYGSFLEYERVYNANKDMIETKAKERGKNDSSNGHWLFPGTTLTIPPKEAG